MARTPVLLETPKERGVTVLREGAPKRELGIILPGIVGAILLILAFALVGLLPEEDTPLPQYEVSFQQAITTMEGQSILLQEGGSETVAIPFEGQFLYGLAVTLQFQDDIAASLPDEFSVTLAHPNGTTVLGPKSLYNRQPTGDAANGFQASEETQIISFQLAPRPSTEILSAETHQDTLADMEMRAAALGGEPSGTWSLAVSLPNAGDCPAPESFNPSRTSACFIEANDGTDTGNEIQILEVQFLEYIPTVTLL